MKTLALRIVVGFALLAGACTAPRAEREVLIVGSDLDNAPFASVDAEGHALGRDVEMLELVARELGCALEWRRMPFDALFHAVESELVDVLCATIGVTPERAARMAFTQPYFETTIAVVVRAGPGEPRALTGVSGLAGRRVAGGLGTTSERAVRAKLPDAIGVFESKAELPAAERLRTRAIDALALDGPAADALVVLGRGEFVKLEPALERELYALVVPLSRDDLRARLDAALSKLRASGELAALDSKFGLAR